MILALLWLVACDRPDPELVATREALDAWEQGAEHLERGEPDQAQAAFDEALAHRDDPLLTAWKAQAAAEQGDLTRAVALVGEVLAEEPEFAEARYNRAAWRARQDAPAEQVARDLQRALGDGASSPRAALEDPDFVAYIDHPAFDFLPKRSLTIAAEAMGRPVHALEQDTTVFWGDDVPLRFRVAGAGERPIAVTAETTDGPVRLARVVDQSNPSTQGTFRDLTWTFEVVGAGPIRLGPFHAWVGERRATVEAVALSAAAPADKEVPSVASRVVDFKTPGEVAGRGERPAVRRLDDGLVIVFEPGDKVVVEPEPPDPPVVYEKRRGNQILWTAWRYPRVDDEVSVQVIRGGQPIHQGP